jgi:hypothetical protein
MLRIGAEISLQKASCSDAGKADPLNLPEKRRTSIRPFGYYYDHEMRNSTSLSNPFPHTSKRVCMGTSLLPRSIFMVSPPFSNCLLAAFFFL